MTVMEMLTASIPLEVTTATVTLAMKEMDSTAQVLQSCEVHYTYANNVDLIYIYLCTVTELTSSFQISMNASWVLISV